MQDKIAARARSLPAHECPGRERRLRIVIMHCHHPLSNTDYYRSRTRARQVLSLRQALLDKEAHEGLLQHNLVSAKHSIARSLSKDGLLISR